VGVNVMVALERMRTFEKRCGLRPG